MLTALILAAVLTGSTIPSVVGSCSPFQSATASCTSTSGSVTDTGAVLNGTTTHGGTRANPGANPRSGASTKNGKAGSRPHGGASAPVSPPPLRDNYGVTMPSEPVPPRPVTLSDVAGFVPSSGIDHMEPEGWMIVGLPVNFYVTGGHYEIAGMLLGQPATVSFAPVAYRWTYGDGASATRTTTGSTWLAQGLSEFEPTSTSHVYAARGTYFIDLTITLTASYRFAGGSSHSIAGTVPLRANRLQAYAGTASTVLVANDCLDDPAGPGCE